MLARKTGWMAVLMLLAGWPLSGAAQDADLKAILAKMEALEKKVADQATEIQKLKAAKGPASATDAAVESVLAKSSASAVLHDPELHKRAVKIGGYFDISYQYNLNRPENRNNNLRAFDRDSNGFNVHLAKVDFDGTAQECGQAGFRLDLAFGSDANKFAASDLSGLPTDRLFDLEQAYVDYIAPIGKGVRLKMGKFVTCCGLEVIEAADNWNASRSYGFFYGVPATHTGFAAEYQVFENWAVKGFVVNGWDALQDNNDGKTFLFMSDWKPAKWFQWIVTGSVGNERSISTPKGAFDADDDPDTPDVGLTLQNNDTDTRYMLDTSLIFTPWEKWTFAINAVAGLDENGSTRMHIDPDTELPVPNGGDGEWYTIAGYVKWDFMKNWYVCGRGEYFNDLGGSRTGIAQKLYSLTATAAWTLSAPLQIRFEYRHDGSSENPFADTESDSVNPVSGSSPGSRRGRATQDSFMLQWLYKF